MNQSTFEKFIGVDWSGARYPKNLAVAVCEPGMSVPKPEAKYWRRDTLVNWIAEEANQRRILVGVDFAFAYPYCEHGAYFPNHPKSPESVVDLWQTVDNICRDERYFYGGPFYQNRASPFSSYFCYRRPTGSHFDNNRLRKTERACAAFGHNTRPTCVFKCVGPDQVGAGSAAGMRALHFLTTNHHKTISIWPFDSLSRSKSIVVEIFPRLFFAITGEDSRHWQDDGIVNAVLRYFGSEPLAGNITRYTEDEVDAIISAAALRNLSSRPEVWRPLGLDKETQRSEGWIFGCM